MKRFHFHCDFLNIYAHLLNNADIPGFYEGEIAESEEIAEFHYYGSGPPN